MSDELTKEQWKEIQNRFIQAVEDAANEIMKEKENSIDGKTELERELSYISMEDLYKKFTI